MGGKLRFEISRQSVFLSKSTALSARGGGSWVQKNCTGEIGNKIATIIEDPKKEEQNKRNRKTDDKEETRAPPKAKGSVNDTGNAGAKPCNQVSSPFKIATEKRINSESEISSDIGQQNPDIAHPTKEIPEGPPEHRNLNFYESGDSLIESVLGPTHLWAGQLPQQCDTRGRMGIVSDEEAYANLHESTLKVLECLKHDHRPDFLENCTPHFS